MEHTPHRTVMKVTSASAQRWAEGLRKELERWPGVVVKTSFWDGSGLSPQSRIALRCLELVHSTRKTRF